MEYKSRKAPSVEELKISRVEEYNSTRGKTVQEPKGQCQSMKVKYRMRITGKMLG